MSRSFMYASNCGSGVVKLPTGGLLSAQFRWSGFAISGPSDFRLLGGARNSKRRGAGLFTSSSSREMCRNGLAAYRMASPMVANGRLALQVRRAGGAVNSFSSISSGEHVTQHKSSATTLVLAFGAALLCCLFGLSLQVREVWPR